MHVCVFLRLWIKVRTLPYRSKPFRLSSIRYSNNKISLCFISFYPIPLVMFSSWRHMQARTSYSTSWHSDLINGKRSFFTLQREATVDTVVSKQATKCKCIFTLWRKLFYIRCFIKTVCFCHLIWLVKWCFNCTTHIDDSNLPTTFPKMRQLARRAGTDWESWCFDNRGLRICANNQPKQT